MRSEKESKVVPRFWPGYLRWKSQEDRQGSLMIGQFRNKIFDHIEFEVHIGHLGRDCQGNLKKYNYGTEEQVCHSKLLASRR